MLHRQDGVAAVTALTSRRELVAAGQGFAVEAVFELFLLCFMAGSATDRGGLLMRKLFSFKVSVAGDTGETSMRGRGEFFPVHIE